MELIYFTCNLVYEFSLSLENSILFFTLVKLVLLSNLSILNLIYEGFLLFKLVSISFELLLLTSLLVALCISKRFFFVKIFFKFLLLFHLLSLLSFPLFKRKYSHILVATKSYMLI